MIESLAMRSRDIGHNPRANVERFAQWKGEREKAVLDSTDGCTLLWEHNIGGLKDHGMGTHHDVPFFGLHFYVHRSHLSDVQSKLDHQDYTKDVAAQFLAKLLEETEQCGWYLDLDKVQYASIRIPPKIDFEGFSIHFNIQVTSTLKVDNSRWRALPH